MKNYLALPLFLFLFNTSGVQSYLQLTSPAFSNNGMIPEKYTCDGENVSPRLDWTGAPASTKSFALLVEDPDALGKTWVHWLLFNISPTMSYLPENVITGDFMSGATDFHGAQNYGGPCPPSGTHRYIFTFFALDTMFDLIQEGADKSKFLNMIHDHVLDKATLIGKYRSKK
jgi:hypothetical protein